MGLHGSVGFDRSLGFDGILGSHGGAGSGKRPDRDLRRELRASRAMKKEQRENKWNLGESKK